jgi:hypothetical protein
MQLGPKTRIPSLFSRRETLSSLLVSAVGFTAAQPSQADSGLKIVTESELGQMVRYNAIKGAQVADAVDEFWEKFSDKLRERDLCDEATGRRRFDNGFRSDGSRIGNPGLGALCKPNPLQPLLQSSAQQLLDLATLAAVKSLGKSESTLGAAVNSVDGQVRQVFERTYDESVPDDFTRKKFNFAVYSKFKAYSSFVTRREDQRNFEREWGALMLGVFARSCRGREDFSTRFPLPDKKDVDALYDLDSLLDGLGTLSCALRTMENAGLIGNWEISIPSDDDGQVATIAIDDDVSLNAQSLLREQRCLLYGAATEALTIACLEQAGIRFRMDSYLIDPKTTNRENYSPTQLLISLSNLRAA